MRVRGRQRVVRGSERAIRVAGASAVCSGARAGDHGQRRRGRVGVGLAAKATAFCVLCDANMQC